MTSDLKRWNYTITIKGYETNGLGDKTGEDAIQYILDGLAELEEDHGAIITHEVHECPVCYDEHGKIDWDRQPEPEYIKKDDDYVAWENCDDV